MRRLSLALASMLPRRTPLSAWRNGGWRIGGEVRGEQPRADRLDASRLRLCPRLAAIKMLADRG